jgi:hypothetical protein
MRILILLALALVAACGHRASTSPAARDAAPPRQTVPDAARATAAPDATAAPSQELGIHATQTHGEHSEDTGSDTYTYDLRGTTLAWSLEADGAYSAHVDTGSGSVTLTADQVAALDAEIQKRGMLANASASNPDGKHSYDKATVTIERGGQQYALTYANGQASDAHFADVQWLLGELQKLVTKPASQPPPAGGLSIRATTTHGEHSKDSGSETDSYSLDGTTLAWSVDASGSYRMGVDAGKGSVTLTDAQLSALDDEIQKLGLVADASAKHPDGDSSYDSASVTIGRDGKQYVLTYENGTSSDPQFDAAQSLLATLHQLARPQ